MCVYVNVCWSYECLLHMRGMYVSVCECVCVRMCVCM